MKPEKACHGAAPPHEEYQPLLILTFPSVRTRPSGVELGLELHLWLFKGRSQVEWVTRDGIGLGMVMGAAC